MDNEETNGNGHADSGMNPEARQAGKLSEEVSILESDTERANRLERERDEIRERMLRVAADFENYKKRTRREVDDGAVRSREQVLREILPVLDNFERAMIAAGKGGTVESLAQGVRLVEKQLQAAIEKFGVKAFEAKGELFDPTRHEAIQQVETADQAAGTVVDVFARGYWLGDKLLRAAMVSVARAPSRPVAEATASPDSPESEDGAPPDATS